MSHNIMVLQKRYQMQVLRRTRPSHQSSTLVVWLTLMTAVRVRLSLCSLQLSKSCRKGSMIGRRPRNSLTKLSKKPSSKVSLKDRFTCLFSRFWSHSASLSTSCVRYGRSGAAAKLFRSELKRKLCCKKLPQADVTRALVSLKDDN